MLLNFSNLRPGTSCCRRPLSLCSSTALTSLASFRCLYLLWRRYQSIRTWSCILIVICIFACNLLTFLIHALVLTLLLLFDIPSCWTFVLQRVGKPQTLGYGTPRSLSFVPWLIFRLHHYLRVITDDAIIDWLCKYFCLLWLFFGRIYFRDRREVLEMVLWCLHLRKGALTTASLLLLH